MLARTIRVIGAAKDNSALRRGGYIFAIALFLSSLIWAISKNPSLFDDILWTPFILLVVIGVPVTFVLNAFDIMLTAKLTGSQFSIFEALKISVLSRAANMLPLPGGPLVRIAALKKAGAGYKLSSAATLMAALIWLSISFFMSGCFLLTLSLPVAVCMIGISIFALVASYTLSTGLHDGLRNLALLAVLKVTATIVGAARLGLCLWALTASVSIADAVIISASTVASSIIVILPDGLGAREAISGALAAIIGLGASTGIFAVVLNRVAGLIAISPIALYFALLPKNNLSATIKPSNGTS